ncbi:MAG: tRNA (adenosine(37)-N6)-threonylcarbamoyltransferase complex ATPase subunit type 1 TsaE [Alphaproteobacteria bacterium]|nr:tRNA (adenosine(37)-N6)-threonylcarbamoyltransferase complex ATPase subunit type 1 TsaE [Alphaproteobacteria bacterium]
MQQGREQEAQLAVTARGDAETARVAAAVAHVSIAGDVLALAGDLGSGKTAFARGFIRALTAPDEEVPSPTFTLVQTYAAAGRTIYHFDLYRIEAPDEAWELGIEEAFAGGVTLIEWPERLGRLLPADRLDIRLNTPPGGGASERRITLIAGPSWRGRLARLRGALGTDADG